jgi:hypothetical protein
LVGTVMFLVRRLARSGHENRTIGSRPPITS